PLRIPPKIPRLLPPPHQNPSQKLLPRPQTPPRTQTLRHVRPLRLHAPRRRHRRRRLPPTHTRPTPARPRRLAKTHARRLLFTLSPRHLVTQSRLARLS